MTTTTLRENMVRHAAHAIADIAGWTLDAGAHLMFSTAFSKFLIAPYPGIVLVPTLTGHEFQLAEKARVQMRCDIIFIAQERSGLVRMSISPSGGEKAVLYDYALWISKTHQMFLVPHVNENLAFEVSPRPLKASTDRPWRNSAQWADGVSRADRIIARRMISAPAY